MDVRHIGVAVVDRDASELSRRIVSDLDASSFFSVTVCRSYDAAMDLIENDRADVILEIPSDFFKYIVQGRLENPRISANGVNGMKGMLGARYVTSSVLKSMADVMGLKISEDVTVNYFYNPTLEYRNYMIPALMIMLLIMLCGFLPALNLVGEKEKGTIEQMNVTPVKTSVFILSKLIPYWIIGVVVISLAMLIAHLVYGLQPAGSLVAIYTATVLFIFVMSGIGILIANYSSTMSQSMFLMFFIVMLFVLMSGLLTPVSSMPAWARGVSCAFPPRYYIEIMRSLYLRGSGFNALVADYIFLAVFAIAANILAALTYKKQR